MARLGVYRTPGGTGQGYVLDVQADLLDHLVTRAVVPLLPQTSAPSPIRDLNPLFDINGEPHVMLTQAIASIPAKELRHPVTALTDRHDEVTRALDILFAGL